MEKNYVFDANYTLGGDSIEKLFYRKGEKKPLKCKYKNMKIGFFLSMYMSDMKYVRFNQQKKIQIFMNSENIKYTFAARMNR